MSEKEILEKYGNLESYIYFLERKNKQLKDVIGEARKYIKSKQFEENFPYEANEYQVRGALLKILEDKGE